MNNFVRVLRSDDVVPDAVATPAFSMLVPIIEKAPTATDAIEAARTLIGRCVPSDESPLAAVLDWWFVVTTGEPTANNGAHRLPGSLDPSVRLPMQAIMRLVEEGLVTDRPVAEWLRRNRELATAIPGVEKSLELSSHGASKLPGERQAWDQATAEFRPAVTNIRSNRRAEAVETDRRDFEQTMRAAGIDKNSRRWNEMVKRWQTTITAINHAVELQHLVQPWVLREVPDLVTELPSAVELTVGPLAAALLRPVLAESAAGSVDPEVVAEQLDAACRSADRKGRYRLARLACAWWQETRQEIPALDELLERHETLTEALTTLRQRPGVDTQDVELHLMDDDIDNAEAAVRQIQETLARRERLRRVAQQYESLCQKVTEGGLSEEPDWQERLQHHEVKLREVEADLDTTDPRELEREIAATSRHLSVKLDSMLQERVGDLEDLVDRLEALRSPASVLSHWRGRVRDIQAQPGGRGASDLKRKLSEEVDEHLRTGREEVGRLLQETNQILTDESADFGEEVLAEFVARRSAVDSLLLRDTELDAEDLIDARTRAESLRRDLDTQRIPRWRASEGEARLLEHLIAYCTESLDFDETDIRRLHVSIKTKPFVILAGLTGSGKSSLTRLYAEALGANSNNEGFRRVAVRPDWIDQSEVLGFVNPVSNRFVPGWLAETVRRCERRPDRLHFVLLDEMNLAPVEQYLAELLSAMEEARSGSEKVHLRLYAEGEEPENRYEWQHELSFPQNLVIVGTVNVDETTRPLSERVIDRANVLHLSVEVTDRHHHGSGQSEGPWQVDFAEWQKVCESVPTDVHHPFLVEVARILRSAGIGVGLRAHVELERFLANAVGVMEDEPALDWGIVQRIIPKIRGFKGQLTGALEDLVTELETVGASESVAIVRRWLDDGVSDDEYLDGTDPRLTLARRWERDENGS
jgi:hypothetical protein